MSYYSERLVLRMAEERTLKEQVLQIHGEMQNFKGFVSRIITTLQASDEAIPQIGSKLVEIAKEFSNVEIEFMVVQQATVLELIGDLDIVEFDPKDFLEVFQEFLDDINSTLTLFNAEAIQQAESQNEKNSST